jgi:hypothetical protein
MAVVIPLVLPQVVSCIIDPQVGRPEVRYIIVEGSIISDDGGVEGTESAGCGVVVRPDAVDDEGLPESRMGYLSHNVVTALLQLTCVLSQNPPTQLKASSALLTEWGGMYLGSGR